MAVTALFIASAIVFAGGDREADVSTGVDAEIREDVEAALARDGRVEAADIQVTVEGGVVRLVGTVDSIRERNAAVAGARNVLGVISVVDDLEVEPDATASGDRLLALDVRAALATDPSVDASDIIVEASGSQITLYGSVDTLYERERAADTAADVIGVVTVLNQLTVEPTTDRGDREIRRDVQNALVRNSLVDRENIVVLVNDGQVTLTGTVSSWVEEQEALDAAQFTAGVTSVVDQLEIAGPDFDGVTGRTIRTQVREQLE
ncbi:MAG: BON domain-containing protein, partial [Spirochaetota bacterium]